MSLYLLRLGAEKAKSLSDSTVNSYDLEFFSGEMKEVGSSVRLGHVVSASEGIYAPSSKSSLSNIFFRCK